MVELNERTAVLLDQHPLFLEALEHVLGHIGVRTVGKTGSPESALGLVEDHRPDLFVTSIELPEGGMDGIACLREASNWPLSSIARSAPWPRSPSARS